MEELGAYKVEKSGKRRSSVERREEILEVALSVLAERGYRGASMREIAERAQASKETLYSWFGNKRELFEELVGWQAERVDAVIAPNLERGGDPCEVLRGFALELQRLLLGERSVVINRAAISEVTSDPTFAQILATQGRGSVVPKLVRYLEGQREGGHLHFEEAEAAIDTLIGLAIGDQQVRRLLGVLPSPGPSRSKRALRGRSSSFSRCSVASAPLKNGELCGEGEVVSISIRPYRAEDAMAVREVHLRAFEDRREEALLVELLHTASAAVVSLVAAADPEGRVVGHILFSPVQVDGRGSDPPIMVGLAPVAVLPEHQGRGIGTQLIRERLQACREAGYGVAVVLGEPGYYSRFGFEQASGKGLGNEYGVDEHFMVAELSNGALDGVSGTVRYREEFREVSA